MVESTLKHWRWNNREVSTLIPFANTIVSQRHINAVVRSGFNIVSTPFAQWESTVAMLWRKSRNRFKPEVKDVLCWGYTSRQTVVVLAPFIRAFTISDMRNRVRRRFRNNAHKDGISLFLFPKCDQQRKKWIKLVKMTRTDSTQLYVNTMSCVRHILCETSVKNHVNTGGWGSKVSVKVWAKEERPPLKTLLLNYCAVTYCIKNPRNEKNTLNPYIVHLTWWWNVRWSCEFDATNHFKIACPVAVVLSSSIRVRVMCQSK